jgi:hypothetical protein
MKLLLFILDEKQKKAIQEFLFVALFGDSNNEHAYQCFQIFSLHLWYFHVHDEFIWRGASQSPKTEPFTFAGDTSFYSYLLSELLSTFPTLFADLSPSQSISL